MDKKIIKKHIDHSLGFPVIILNAPLIKVRGKWTLNINYKIYSEMALTLLAHKQTKLTGSEIQFIRKHFELTVRAFANRFAIKHSAVIKWEKKKDDATKAMWSIEKDIRLFILDELNKKAIEIYKLYRILEQELKEPSKPIDIDAKKIAA
jgi:transcriptional regulator with XRE-family HTH domain